MKRTRKEQPWISGREQAKAFSDVQKLVTQASVLMYFDVNKPITVQCDSGEKGMGGVLLQDGRPVVYASWALWDTETKYVQIEKEMLAIVWSLERFHQYIFGKHIVVQSDHKPLESLMCKPLSNAYPAEHHICSNAETDSCITFTKINQGNSTSKIKPMNNNQVFIHITTDLIILIYIYHTLFGNLKNNGKRRML